jgi:hypothetical protein
MNRNEMRGEVIGLGYSVENDGKLIGRVSCGLEWVG